MTESVDSLLKAHLGLPCVMLVSPDVALVRLRAESLSRDKGWPILSVGRVLGPELASVLPSQRHLELRPLWDSALDLLPPGPVVVLDIDLLFEPSLHCDPLYLFTACARRRPLVIAWLGTYQERVLAYAVPEHAHFRTWSAPNVSICCLEPLAQGGNDALPRPRPV